ncbi:methylamine utilization protein [Hyunsoonleella sp. SJ7]|uniref:Methylamine utilization protein n=1 Tax=Hyunsoonleella aquatilis TaxID=2762758 RepID=A0A923KL47_9FLAO|nr:cytochrome c peroxidase [Hyunsoonleella aquatilis]MBC3757535.1 methylamine utilization protein [Hyunsoonleella aquatilis]
MNQHIFVIKAKTYILSICLLLLIGTGCNQKKKALSPPSVNELIATLFNSEIENCAKYLDTLVTKHDIFQKIRLYKKARQHFKLAEPILAYVDQNNYKSLNAPNILQVHEEDPSDIKIRNPFGFQVIEELLFEDNPDTLKINETAKITSSRLKLVKNNTLINLKDYHIIWLVRNQIVRIATTGITGFDSPVLTQSLTESQRTYQTLEDIVNFNKSKFKSINLYQQLIRSIQEAKESLNEDFENFDRYAFIKNYTNPQLELLVSTQKDWDVSFPFELALSNDITSLFSKNAINTSFFTDYKSDTTQLQQKVAFGKQLFSDKNLSRNKNMACATCHIKDKAFTDGRTTFNTAQKRNTPTLNYSSFQQLYFMDARMGSLEGQIVGVVNNHAEFDMTMEAIVQRVKKDKNYRLILDSLYKDKRDDFNIRHAIASYVRTLNSFDSKFDNNINTIESSLSSEEIKGFNLFMGKASCATCHFPPIFNGTVPPNFTDTELEIIGVAETSENKSLSDDLGRYELFKTVQRKGAFKTPTIRNIELTAPYMHNGVYQTLEEVLDFYNKGGGAGLGFDVPHQTLPFDNLGLSEDEQLAIIAFMKTLTDNILETTTY